MKVALFEPEIPQNTGNIIRTCSVTATGLVLVRPLGFRLSDRLLKRSGLDYHNVPIEQIDSIDEYVENQDVYFFSSHAKKRYTDVKYTKDSLLVFGSETSGLPDHLYEKYPERFVTLPMREEARCLNLANSVAIALYEAHRQNDFLF
ncbi:MAG: tRNA (cytidine(34)-2'-O)-methyltransferase [Simkaniaceae bacterium]|nr:tRNA (cytidine(34)-2'-O)-methyltransferase [Simkaniaceae bacterium]